MTSLTPRTCRYCRCHGETCTLPDGEKCAWSNADCTVCNAPGCLRAELARSRAVKPMRPRPKYAGWGYGAILEDLRKQRRRGRRRKAA